jgi:hypothetical protein
MIERMFTLQTIDAMNFRIAVTDFVIDIIGTEEELRLLSQRIREKRAVHCRQFSVTVSGELFKFVRRPHELGLSAVMACAMADLIDKKFPPRIIDKSGEPS